MNFLKTLHARKGQGIAGAFIALMVAVIIGVAVTIPVVQDTIDDANLTGTTGTLVGYLPLLIGVALIVAAVSVIGFKR